MHYFSTFYNVPDTDTLEIPITETQWPSGNYGLPKPKSGCPSNEWGEGYRYHDSENYRNGNYQSNRSHLAGEVNDHGIAQRFCMHHEKFTAENILWPWGQYCIYKKGTRCPKGLEEGGSGTVFNSVFAAAKKTKNKNANSNVNSMTHRKRYEKPHMTTKRHRNCKQQ